MVRHGCSAARHCPRVALVLAVALALAPLCAAPAARATLAARGSAARVARLPAVPESMDASRASAAVVTNCRTYDAAGSQGTGLLIALRVSTQITFNCDPSLSGGPGPFTLVVTGTITIARPTTIDGSDNGAHDVTISGGDTQQIFLVQQAAALTLARLTLAHGSSISGNGSGGAIETDGDLTVLDSTFQDNYASRLGGAIDIGSNRPSSHPVVLVDGSTFVDNAAGSYGGAVEADVPDAPVWVTNSTFVGNTAAGAGGAIRNGVARMTVANSTFSDNTSPHGSALSNSGRLILRNSILANNPGPCDGFRVITDGGYNLEYPDPAPTYCGFSAARGDLFTNPQLGGLANNGGPTLTELPGLGSPAIHGGNPVECSGVGHALSVDQRGLPRPYPKGGRCDIGAVEVQPHSALVLATSASPGDIGQPLTITATIELATTTTRRPGGTIAFALAGPDGSNTSLGTAPLGAQGKAVVTATGTLFSQPGSYSLTAVYHGDGRNATLTAALTEVVRACDVSAYLGASAGRLAIVATTAITSTVYTLNFVAPAGYFTARGASLTVCDNPSAATATARIEGIVRVAGGAFAPGDRVTVTLTSGGRVEAEVADARAGHIYRLTAPFGISSFARIVTH